MTTAFSGGRGGERREDGSIGLLDFESPIRRSRPIRWLIACGVLLIAAIVIGTTVTVGNFRERALANSERELENTVSLLVRHFDQQIQQLELVQKAVVQQIRSAGIASREDFEREMSGNDVHLTLRSRIDALPQISNLSLTDSDGKLINSANGWPAPAVTIADRGYFQALKSAPEPTTVLSEPILDRVTGTRSTILAQSLIGPKGEFLGAVLGGIELAQFEAFFTSLALGDGASITILHRDGTLLARYPHVESLVGRNLRANALFQLAVSGAGHGTARLHSLLDGQDRLVAIRGLSHFPMVVSAATTISAALGGWWEQTRFVISVAGLVALVIVLILFLIVRQISRDHRLSIGKQALEKQRLDIAVNNMTQGLLLFDSSERIVVCNRQFIEMFRLSTDVIKPGCSFREVIAHRKQTGTFVGDVDEYCSPFLRKIALGKVTRNVLVSADGRSTLVVNRPLGDGGWVTTLEDITERKRSEERIAHMAHYDALTDLPNRVLFREKLVSALKTVSRGEQLAVFYIDIDEFKRVNDSLGHPAGDELLKAVADRLRGCLRETDVVARLGGDEFAIIRPRWNSAAMPRTL